MKVILPNFEFTLLRILFSVYLFINYPFQVRFNEQPFPHGLAQFFDLTFFSDPNMQTFLPIGVLVALIFYCTGRMMIVSLIFLLVATIVPVTLLHSQGYINHRWNIFPLILFGQLLAYVFKIENMVLHFSRQVIASIYVTAGISKLIASGWMWPFLASNFAPYVMTTHAQEYYAKLQPGLIEKGEWMAQKILEYPQLFVILLGVALLIELSAFLAVLNRFLAFLIGLSLIIMHESIRWIMSLDFRQYEFVIFLFLILPYLIQILTKKRIEPILQRFPLKLTLLMVVLGLLLYEWYPFSAFPMFTRLKSQTEYYFITDENKNPIATYREFLPSDEIPTTMMRTRIRQAKNTLGEVNLTEIGTQFLHYFNDNRINSETAQYQKLLLWKVTVLRENSSLLKKESMVSSYVVP